jgi:hypothetical protein
MAEKASKPLEGFDVLADFLVGPKDGMKPDSDKNVQYQDIDPDDLQKQISGVDEPADDKQDDDTKPKDDLDKPIDTPPIDKKDDNIDVKDQVNDDDKEYGSEISSFFAGQLVKELGIDEEFKDVKFENIGEVIELMKEVISENSRPTYASEEVEKYDEFVRNGGDLKSFYKEAFSNKLDLDAVDVEKEYDQRAVIRENLLNQGYREDKIKRMLSRYEEAETLKEEAEDALELLKEHNIKKQESLLEKQKKDAEMARQQQQKFYEDVNSTIKNISDFRGFPISEKEKRELLQYAFVPDSDGLTKYQKDLRSDVYNILESAYFAKNKDKAKQTNTSNKGDTETFKTLRDKLKARSTKSVDNDNNSKSQSNRSSLGDFGKGIFY